MYTFIPENLKRIMNKLGFCLGLDREGKFYITDNEFRNVMRTIQQGTKTIANNKVKTLFFELDNYQINHERPIFNMIRINNSLDNSILEVIHTKTNNSFIQIKLIKDFNYEIKINLISNGVIELISTDKEYLYYSILEEDNNSNNIKIKNIIEYIQNIDERIMPLMEYYANNYPKLKETISKIKNESIIKSNKEKRRKTKHVA